MYKVGISNNPEKRMKGLCTDYPINNSVLLMAADAVNDKITERSIHKELQPYRAEIMGLAWEWYSAPIDVIRECVLRHTNNTTQLALF